MNRRELLASGMSVMVVSVAGCAGDGGEGSGGPPEPGTDPESLLPEADGWSRGDVQDMAADAVGAERGARAEYESPDGAEYPVEVVEWPEEDGASGAVDSIYDDWAAAASVGVYSFAADGDDNEAAADLLSHSSALTASDV